MKIKRQTPDKYFSMFESYLMTRYDVEADWREIQDYILPQRGIFSRYTLPVRRKASSIKSINTVATEALEVLVSIMMGGVVSPTNPWFQLRFPVPELMQYSPLKNWITDVEKKFYLVFNQSAFYAKVLDMLKELAGFGTGYFYAGGDTENPQSLIRFESLTAGEAVIDTDYSGKVNFLQRILFKTRDQLISQFGKDKVSDRIKDSTVNSAIVYEPILHTVHELDKPTSLGFQYFSAYQEIGTSLSGAPVDNFLSTGFYTDFPYMCPRWDEVGSYVYGSGLGNRSIQAVKQLQEMEKSYLMAVHKVVRPPLNAPARMRGKVKTLPGGVNYYSNPQEKVNELYNVRLDFPAIMEAITKKEHTIREIFYNDILLSSMRDPNASPMRTGEVNKRSEEGLLRIGPTIENLHTEFLIPLISRVFNILAEKNEIPPLPPEYVAVVSGIDVVFISVLAQAQKLVKARPLSAFLQFVGGVAQFDQNALDKVDTDKIIEEYAEVTGVPQNTIRGVKEVKAIRQQRAEMQAAREKQAMQMQQAELQVQAEEAKSKIAKNYADAGAQLQQSSGSAAQGLTPPGNLQ